jgi:glycosyltransferase involved in cell wall biosynthesis
MQPLSLMHVVDSLEFGGLERVVTDLAIAQARRGHGVRVFSINTTTGFAAELAAAGVPVIQGNKQGTLDFGVIRSLRRQVQDHAVQIVHAHNFVPNYYAATALLGLGSRCIQVGTVHDMGMRLSQRKLRWMYRASLMRTAAVAMVGQQVHDRFVGEGYVPAQRATTVLNGIPIDRFTNTEARRLRARQLLGLAADGLVIGAVGRLVPLKNHRQLIECMPELVSRFNGLRLVIVGAGPLEAELGALVESLGMRGHVLLAGQRSDVADVAAGFDIFAQPSLTEGLSIALLEASAAALAIVASRVGGNPEIIHHDQTGLLVPVGDRPALASALARLLDDASLRKRLGEQAAGWVAQHASVDAMADAYDQFYLASRPGHPVAA